MKIVMLMTILLFMSCKSNQAKKDKTRKADCTEFNDKYVAYAMSDKRDSALYYIDKAIFCDPEDDFFKTEKIKLLLKYGDYSNAVEFAEKLSKDDPLTYKMLYGILLLKQGDANADNVLKETYNLKPKSSI